jgi:Secretion system C-terminal sorting domain
MKIVVLFFFCSFMYGQQLHHHMLSAQGGVTTTSTGIKVTSTIAQQGAVGTFSSKSGIVSQGFQQSKISNIAPLPTDLIATLVYPNPIVDVVNFKLSKPVDGKIAVSFFDANGRLVHFQERELNNNTITITNLMLSDGQYFVKLEGNNYSFATAILKSK